MKTVHHIGIDTGKKTGLAIWTPAYKQLDLYSTDFWGVWGVIEDYQYELRPDRTKVRIEMPGSFLYGRNSKHGKRVSVKMAVNVGGVQMMAILLAERFEELGYQVGRPQPSKRKLNHDIFKKITGYTGTTNEHTRDAGMLVYGI